MSLWIPAAARKLPFFKYVLEEINLISDCLLNVKKNAEKSSDNSISRRHFLKISKQTVPLEETIVFSSLAATVVTENNMTSNDGVELRSAVKFCVALNKSPTETLRMVKLTGKYDKIQSSFCLWMKLVF